MKRKNITVLVIAFLCLALSGCLRLNGDKYLPGNAIGTNPTELYDKYNDDPTWPYDTLSPHLDYPLMKKGFEHLADVAYETDYKSVVAEIAQESFSCSTDSIEITLRSAEGKIFYIYDFPMLEYNSDGEWVRLWIEEPRTEEGYAEFGWNIFEPENGECGGSISLKLADASFEPALKDGSTKPVPGQYRIVVFTPVGEIYVPLTLE